jgi:hypothetical protein
VNRYRPHPEWADYVRDLVNQAPLLSPGQYSRLAVLLQPGRDALDARKKEPKCEGGVSVDAVAFEHGEGGGAA